MGKKIIFFDIDDTLIDVHRLAKMFYQDMADQINIPIEKIIDAKEKYKLTLEKSSDYLPDDLVEFVCKEVGFESNKISNPFAKQKFFEQSIFFESHRVLKKLAENYTLGIFSEGFVDYQSKKIVLTGLVKYFDNDLIFIERRKLLSESINKIPVGAVVIDDKKEVIETLAQNRLDLDLIWINRLNDEKIETPKIRTIKTLEELLAIY